MNPHLASRALLPLLVVAMLFACGPLAASDGWHGTEWV